MTSRSIIALALVLPACIYAQGGRGGRGGPAPVAKVAAPIDVTGYWTAVITEDWHERMLTAPKGDFGSGTPGATAGFGGTRSTEANPSAGGNIPYNKAGTELAMKWDPAKDEADANQCKAYGAPGVMRQPTHLHITWQDDNTLKVETDQGTQTRILHFAPPPAQGQTATKLEAPAGEQPSWQGYSVAEWIIQGGRGDWARGGNLKVVTTHLKPGYYWKNGMPYGGSLVLTEHFRVMKEANGDEWLAMSQMAEDPQYLNEPWIITYQFKKMADGSKWNPTPCAAK